MITQTLNRTSLARIVALVLFILLWIAVRASSGQTPTRTWQRECWSRVCCSKRCGSSTPRASRVSASPRNDSWIPRWSCSFTAFARAAEAPRFGSSGDHMTRALVASATIPILLVSMQIGVSR